MFSIIIIPPVYSQTEMGLTLTLDKESYDMYDTIIITGHTENTDTAYDIVSYLLISPYSNRTISSDIIMLDNDSNFYLEIDIFDLIDFISGSPVPITSGNYTIEFHHFEDSSIIIPFQITGKIYSTTTTIQTDNPEYYIGDTISINGTVNDVNWSKDTTITYHVKHGQEIIESGNTTLQNDGTFDFTIDTSTWNTDTSIYPIEVTIQNITKMISINYHNTVNMSPESNYEKIMIQEYKDVEHDTKLDIQNKTLDEYDTMMYTQQEDIIQIKKDVTEQRSFIDVIMTFLGLSGEPPQSNPPVIISLTANDPDDLDEIYSVGDTITIQFDSDTNTPGGIGIQQKSEVNDLFTFSENPAQAYNGYWITPDTFVITVNSINNAEITIGTTRVTPAKITPILPADNTPDASYLISPILNGDWGILLPTGYTSEPQLKCGAGTIEINGYCKVS